jgi:16S rRNA C967 or C1407 C5-methylase (RsmB/RsmF family)/NOL1/NOP2/fmu family ribosome biogenesis protein
MLPQAFLNRMESMLGEEYPAFLESYEKEKYQALRLNSIKGDTAQMKDKVPFQLQPVAWAKDGFYYEKDDTPGKYPLHEAGVYYIQEPSAMAPVSYLMGDYDIKRLPSGASVDSDHEAELHDIAHKEAASCQERILDLCAAPGGKSTQIAARMNEMYISGQWNEQGLLICNEIHPARAKILSENVERMGIANAMVTNETPQRLAEVFEEYFTRILVDAPCSGEGMFRKNEAACEEWSTENVKICAERQDGILDCAASMLAPGGRIVYSTCTFAPAENEGSMTRFLLRHPEFHIVEVKKAEGMSAGVPEWAYFEEEKGQILPEIAQTIRLWPQHLNGEGHYLAVLEKEGTLRQGYCRNGEEKGIPAKDLKVPGKGIVEFLDFAKDTLDPQTLAGLEKNGTYLKFGDQLYLAPKGMPSVKGLKVLRPGLHLGTLKKNRLEPSHALALALKKEQVRYAADLASDGDMIRSYLNGGTFSYDGEKGWYLITAAGFSTGWGKLAGGVMKNHYPKGLRKTW